LFDASSATTAKVTGARVAAVLEVFATEKCVAGPLTLNVFEIPLIEFETVSVATTVSPPEVFSVTKKFPTPFASGEVVGNTAFPSLLVRCTVPE